MQFSHPHTIHVTKVCYQVPSHTHLPSLWQMNGSSPVSLLLSCEVFWRLYCLRGSFCPFIRFPFSVSEQGTGKCPVFSVLLKGGGAVAAVCPGLGWGNGCFAQAGSVLPFRPPRVQNGLAEPSSPPPFEAWGGLFSLFNLHQRLHASPHASFLLPKPFPFLLQLNSSSKDLKEEQLGASRVAVLKVVEWPPSAGGFSLSMNHHFNSFCMGPHVCL